MIQDTNNIADVIKDIVCSELKLEPQALTNESNLRAISGIESIMILRIIVKVEDRFGIELEDQTVFGVETIQDIANAVQALALKQA
jgi:acyl carrier protein